MKNVAWIASAILLLGCQDAPPPDALFAIVEEIDRIEASLIELRRDIHMHPEISGEEERTAALAAEHLRALGFEVRTGVGGHGVVGIKRGPEGAPVVAYRADMDAVPSKVVGDPPYRSTVPNVKHVCGHDLHTAVAVGVASALVAAGIPATLMFLFQPAEERIEGARAMLADGVFAELQPDVIYAIHTAPLPVGLMLMTPGGGLAGFQSVALSWPSSGADGATAARVAEAVNAVSTVPAFAPAGGTSSGLLEDFIAVQVSPEPRVEGDRANLFGMIKAPSIEKFEEARTRISSAVAAIDAVEVRFDPAILPPMLSDPALTLAAVPAVQAVLGEEGAVIDHGVIPYFGEDFAFFQEVVPGAMFLLGVANPEKGITALNHSPDYDVDESAIALGAKSMANVIADYVARAEGDGPENP